MGRLTIHHSSRECVLVDFAFDPVCRIECTPYSILHTEAAKPSTTWNCSRQNLVARTCQKSAHHSSRLVSRLVPKTLLFFPASCSTNKDNMNAYRHTPRLLGESKRRPSPLVPIRQRRSTLVKSVWSDMANSSNYWTLDLLVNMSAGSLAPALVLGSSTADLVPNFELLASPKMKCGLAPSGLPHAMQTA